MTNIEFPAEGAFAATLRHWEVCLASFVGSSFVAIADILVNGPKAVTTRVGTIAASLLGEVAATVSADTLSFLVMVALGLGLCFVYRPKTRPGAFVRGSSVIAVLALMNTGAGALVGEAHGQTVQLSANTRVSTCKPRTYGPFGLGTVLRGDAKACWTTGLVKSSERLACTSKTTVGNTSYCAVKLSSGKTVWVTTK